MPIACADDVETLILDIDHDAGRAKLRRAPSKADELVDRSRAKRRKCCGRDEPEHVSPRSVNDAVRAGCKTAPKPADHSRANCTSRVREPLW
jgi:hypothetical protein